MLKSRSFPERIAIVEFDSSHDECFLTQVNALKKRGCWIILITNEVVRNRNAHLESLVDEWLDIDPEDSNGYRKGLTGAAFGDALIIRRLMRRLKRLKVDKVIFNTAQGGHVRNACLFSLFRKVEFIGIIHTIRKFQGSFTQRLINLKIKKYFVLGEFLKEGVISTSPNQQRVNDGSSTIVLHKGLLLSSFYPVDFPKGIGNTKNDDSIHLVLMGSVEARRKDLDGFVSLVKQCDARVHFHFLGKADPTNSDVIKLKEALVKNHRSDRVTFYDSFVNPETVDLILRKSHAILPLIHPDTPSAEEYFRHQIPGSMSVALGYQLPLLMHENYKVITELNDASIYYQPGTFSNALDELKSRGEEIRDAIQSSEKYTSDYQYQRILGLIFGEL